MNTNPHLELIIGTMFSGKSTELIRRVNRYEIAGYEIQLFKPAMDKRYSQEYVTSHDGLQKEVEFIQGLAEMEKRVRPTTEVLGIDEVQFMESDVVNFCDAYAQDGKIVVASGLLKDFQDKYFIFKDKLKDMSALLRIADHVTYLKAICTYQEELAICGNEATRVQRVIDGKVAPADSPTVKVGGKKDYAPRCRKHFQFYD